MPNFLDDLRAMAQAVRDQSTKELTVAGSGGHIAVRYRPPAREKLDAVLAAFNFGQPLTGDDEMQLLVDCCDAILSADPDTGQTTPYDDEGPLRFDASDPRWQEVAPVLAEIHGVPVKVPETARECVAVLFCLDAQPLAASRHATSLVTWLQGIDAEIAARVEGKSPGSPGDA